MAASSSNTLRKTIVSVVAITAIVVVAVFLGKVIANTRVIPKESQRSSDGYRVEVLKVAREDYHQVLSGFGTAKAIREAIVSAEVGGKIVAVNPDARVGAAVESGETLYRIDDADYQEELSRRKSILAQANTDLSRLRGEVENLKQRVEVATKDEQLAQNEVARLTDLETAQVAGRQATENAQRSVQQARRGLLEIQNMLMTRQSEIARVEAQLEARRAEIELARLNLERCDVRAPFAGTVAERLAEQGELVRNGSALMRITDISTVEIAIQLPASEAGATAVGHAAQIELTQGRDSRWVGSVARISPEIDPTNRTVGVYLQVDNTRLESPLLPGQLVEAKIEGKTFADKVVIPRRAVIGSYAYVAANGVATRRAPQILRAIGDEYIIESGVEPGEQLILTNLDLMYEGAKILVTGELNGGQLREGVLLIRPEVPVGH